MHYSDDEHQWEIQQSHEVVSKFKLTKGENGIMKPNEQTEQNDSQPVNIVAPHTVSSSISVFNYSQLFKICVVDGSH